MNTAKLAKHLNAALERFEAGFATKQARQDALACLSRAYDVINEHLRANLIQVMRVEHEDLERRETASDLYYDLPMYLHTWRPATSARLLHVFPEDVEVVRAVDELLSVREAIKAAEIRPATPKKDPRVETITQTIREMMEKRKVEYERGLALHDLFGGLIVWANVHMVTNQYGTTFPRCVYYMEGKVTALDVILAVLDTKAREAEAAQGA